MSGWKWYATFALFVTVLVAFYTSAIWVALTR